MRIFAIVMFALSLGSGAWAAAIRAPANTMIIDAGAAPAFGQKGEARVASKSAAVEAIKSGFDRHIINCGQSQSDIIATQSPGAYHTSGCATINRGVGTCRETKTCTPAPTIVLGSHKRSLGVVMFCRGEVCEQAYDAYQMLGPERVAVIRTGVHTYLSVIA